MSPAKQHDSPPTVTAIDGWMGTVWFDALLYQVAWWSCILTVRAGAPHLASLPPLVYFAIHLTTRPRRRALILRAALQAALFGLVADSLLVNGGVLAFPHAAQASLTQPWMVTLWLAMGVSLTSALLPFARLGAPLRALLGSIAGLAAYRGGTLLGVVAVSDGVMSQVWIGLEWAIASGLLAHTVHPRYSHLTSTSGRETCIRCGG